jgi:hypothetical protein
VACEAVLLGMRMARSRQSSPSRIQSLIELLRSRLITTEAPWTQPSPAQRIEMQRVAVEAILRELAERRGI